MSTQLLARNVGTPDRIVRVLVGAALIAMVFAGPRSMWGLIGVVPLMTAIVGTCPLYTLLRVSTCGRTAPPDA